MKYYPTTDKPIWGQTQTWYGMDRWSTTLQFDQATHCVQDVIPAFTQLTAQLELAGDTGVYQLRFPGGNRQINLKDDSITIDVSSLIRTGKHLYWIEGKGQYAATVKIHAKRPLVETQDEGYLIDWSTYADGERQQMLGDRPAHRVGNWSQWVTLLATHPESTQLKDDNILLDTTFFHPPLAEYHPDFSGVDFDDTQWQSVDLPYSWDDADTEGYAWYRLKTRIPSNWQSNHVILQVPHLDTEALFYVNGHTVGYYEPNGRPAQFEISQYLDYAQDTIITVRLTHRIGTQYTLEPIQIGCVQQYGIAFAGRLYPSDDYGIQFEFLSNHEDKLQPIGFTSQSQILYCPPEIHLKQLSSAMDNVRVMTDANEQTLYANINADSRSITTVRVMLDATLLKFNGMIIEKFTTDSFKIQDSQNDSSYLIIKLPGLVSWTQKTSQHTKQHPLGYSTITLDLEFQGNTTLSIMRNHMIDKSYDDALNMWDDIVYKVARPHQMSDTEAAAWRTYKQTVLFNSRNVEDDAVHGLLAAFDKPVFHVYWMRDCAISVPGAIYAGGMAQDTAFENIGATLDQYAELPSCIGLYPDGTPRDGNFSDGPALGIGAQNYGWALKGHEWLEEHYQAVTQQLAYLLDIDTTDGDALDGFIRNSSGDWKDAGSMRRLWRVGAVLFVNVCYLRALRVASDMAEALGYTNDAHHWRSLRTLGIDMLNRDVTDGGLWMPEHGYYAEWVQVNDEKSWVYPRDIDNVTVFSAFASTAHGMALAERIVPADRVDSICNAIEQMGLLDPLPAPAQYPFYDVLAETDPDMTIAEAIPLSNPWKLEEFFPDLPDWLTYDMVLPWKGMPGNHVWGGRWMMSGAWLTLGLWRVGQTDLAQRAQNNLAQSLRRSRHPGRCVEVESYSAVSRAETGSHVDPAGYYQLWSGAVPLQSIVEGAYGVIPTYYGASLDLRHCKVGDGILNVPIRNGYLSYQRTQDHGYEITIESSIEGRLSIISRHTITSPNPIDLMQSDTEPDMYWLHYEPNSHIVLTITEEGA